MPKLWNDTIDAHRQSVRDATMDATAALIATEGFSAVSMSRIAQDTGIGRATLYKYFADVDAILLAWHERQIERHLGELVTIRDATPDTVAALKAVLLAYHALSHHGHGEPSAATLHASAHSQGAHHRLQAFLGELITKVVSESRARRDIPSIELASFCLAALAGTGHASTKAATARRVDVVLTGLGICPP